ncbi:MAG: TPM domain-containing protein, partial [Dehalococcoidia bacterium]|nr:TPM domain-containing protein [Dehalococcoidia bacterium]
MSTTLRRFGVASAMLAALLLAALLPMAALAQGLPNPTGYVNDFANVLSPQARQGLEQTLRQIQQDTTAEVVVVTAPSLDGTTVDDYAVRLFEQWRIGKKGTDNGVLLLVAPNERDVRIEVGYGLEPVITDARASQIIRNQVLPRFREGDYDGGVTAAVASLEGYVRSGAPPAPLEENPVKSGLGDWLWVFWPIALVTVYMAGFMARSKTVWLGTIWGGAVGALVGLLIGGVLALGMAVVATALLGAAFDWVLTKTYKTQVQSGRPTGFWGSRGGFRGGPWMGGGFGGGGGGFGG